MSEIIERRYPGWDVVTRISDYGIDTHLVLSSERVDSLIELRCEDLGLSPTQFHKGWIPIEISLSELCRKAEELGFVIRDSNDRNLRNSKYLLSERRGRLRTYITVGENPLTPEGVDAAYVADYDFFLFYEAFVPDENKRWII